MPSDIQKYENWRAITESDFVTMFIKTWFAFVATLREFNPIEDLTKIIGKGDSVFLNPYLKEFASKYISYNELDLVKPNILEVYKLGRQFVLENPKYYRFFQEDFYHLNTNFKYTKETDQFKCTVKCKENTVLVVNVVFNDLKYYCDGKPLITTYEIDFSDLLTSLLNEKTANFYLQDEGVYIKLFAEKMQKKVTTAFLNKFLECKLESKLDIKIYKEIEALCQQDIYNALLLSMSSMTDDALDHKSLLYYQIPCSNFIYKATNNLQIPTLETYYWFLKFVYFLRNALFHEIIDPLENFWQGIFKHSYLALKEILDGNIAFLKEQDTVKGKLYYRVWGEMNNKPDVFIPNLIEAYSDGDLDISFISYVVDLDKLEIKANIGYEYWYGENQINRVKMQCSATVLRNTYDFSAFRLIKISEELVDPF